MLNIFKRNKNALLEDDMLVLSTLEQIQVDLDYIYKSLDEVNDPILIDSFIFEMNALNMRYTFYLNICKERGLVAQLGR